jgi:transketolase
VVALDGDTKNSTFAEDFLKACPDRYFEMYIAEQNMAGTAVGLSARGRKPFCSTFAAFWTRAADQIRMAAYSRANVTFVGSHAGVSIGEDGPSQMGLEDLGLFRALADSVVLYPCDAVSTEALVEALIPQQGISYLRTTRAALPVVYDAGTAFPIGGSRVLRESASDRVCVVAAGITVHEALRAAEALATSNVAVRVVDAYSIRPLDAGGLRAAARACGGRLLTVEDHWPAGGLGEAVTSALADDAGVRVRSLAVRGTPGSGPPAWQLERAGIDAAAIRKAVEEWRD